MVPMIMSYERCIDGRKRVDPDGQAREARYNSANGWHKHRIEYQGHPIKLNEPARVSEPCQTNSHSLCGDLPETF